MTGKEARDGLPIHGFQTTLPHIRTLIISIKSIKSNLVITVRYVMAPSISSPKFGIYELTFHLGRREFSLSLNPSLLADPLPSNPRLPDKAPDLAAEKIMSAPTFTTLPREIRDRVYDFVWDLRRIVSPMATSDHPSSPRRFHPFDHCSADVTLALLHVNHQISAEAASNFYGKRSFCLTSDDLLPFLQGISLRRHLIRDIYVSYNACTKPYCRPDFDLLRSMGGLKSLTVKTYALHHGRALDSLVGFDILGLTDRMDVTVIFERCVIIDGRGNGFATNTEDLVILGDSWRRTKGEREWKNWGVHCRPEDWDGQDHPEFLLGQPCDHDHHRLGRQLFTRI